MQHSVVWAEPGYFGGWPANNGAWRWASGDLLVGFTIGQYLAQPGHDIVEPYENVLARSADGGATWEMAAPHPYVGRPGGLRTLDHPLDFTAPGFAMRVVGTGYHGSDEPRGGFFVSLDYGRHWAGAYAFMSGWERALSELPELAGLELTPRTDYLVEGRQACRVFLSARKPGNWASEKVFAVRTTDGGVSFDFVAWVVSQRDPYRAVMPATVRLDAMRLVTAVRRRDMVGDSGWIDTFISSDGGKQWRTQGRVTDTGPGNGNPPALARMADGRLCCVYGHRGRRQMEALVSEDGGGSWGRPLVLRDDFEADTYDTADLGYPRVLVRDDGALVAIYYWATAARPHQHIAATRWRG